MRTRPRSRGFTLIELLVVLAIIGLLLTIAAPRYIQHVERAREATLRSSLKVMREAIDKFYGDQGHLPKTLDELVDREYLKSIPIDPITDKRDTWLVETESDVAPQTGASASSASTMSRPPQGARASPGVADVHSGASGKGVDGTPYGEY